MSASKIMENIYWVGAVDWNIRSFHGYTYSTPRGTTYNAYLIMDDKITLVDGVHQAFTAELLDNIRQIVPLEKIDYVIVNHIEPDHSGALPEIARLCPRAKFFGTAKAKEALEAEYHVPFNFEIVKTGQKLNIGKRNLMFIEAPMIHWPDSMFTYCPEDELLLPNDAFGQHYGTSERFDDQVPEYVLMEEAAKYYANILWPLGTVILKKLEEIQKMNLPIRMIAPSHGIIWRKDPKKAIEAYLRWSRNETSKKIVVAYETMWGATEVMAKKIVQGITDEGISVRLFHVPVSDRSDMIYEIFNAKGVVIGCSTHDNDILPTMAGFLEFLKGLKPKNRIGCVFGSQGWAGGALPSIEGILKTAGIEICQPALAVKYTPDESVRRACYEYGRAIAKKVKGE